MEIDFQRRSDSIIEVNVVVTALQVDIRDENDDGFTLSYRRSRFNSAAADVDNDRIASFLRRWINRSFVCRFNKYGRLLNEQELTNGGSYATLNTQRQLGQNLHLTNSFVLNFPVLTSEVISPMIRFAGANQLNTEDKTLVGYHHSEPDRDTVVQYMGREGFFKPRTLISEPVSLKQFREKISDTLQVLERRADLLYLRWTGSSEQTGSVTVMGETISYGTQYLRSGTAVLNTRFQWQRSEVKTVEIDAFGPERSFNVLNQKAHVRWHK